MEHFGEHLPLLLLNSFLCIGVYMVARMWLPSPKYGSVLQMATRPLYSCLICMASVHSLPFFWTQHSHHTGVVTVFEWGAYVFALAGMNAIAHRVLE